MSAAHLKKFSPLMPDTLDTRVSVLLLLSLKATAEPGEVSVPNTMYGPMVAALWNLLSPLMPDAADTREVSKGIFFACTVII